jgi:hypothetical protein
MVRRKGMMRHPMTSRSRRAIAEPTFSFSPPQQHCLFAFLAFLLVGNGACLCDRPLSCRMTGASNIWRSFGRDLPNMQPESTCCQRAFG